MSAKESAIIRVLIEFYISKVHRLRTGHHAKSTVVYVKLFSLQQL